MTRKQNAMFKFSIDTTCAMLRRFAAHEGGATAIEYALIASGISIVIVGTVATLGSNVKTMYGNVAAALK
jgi:pilus assembly protein Flp/PilA